MKTLCKLLLQGLGMGGVCLLWMPPSPAAEEVILKYSIFRESISVQELGELSREGKVSPALKSYLGLAKQDPKVLRRWLRRPIPVPAPTLAKVLNSFVGNYVLNQVGQVIHTPTKRASKEALRGALITSAQGDNAVQLIEVLENYPTQAVYLEGDRLMDLYQQLRELRDKIPL